MPIKELMESYGGDFQKAASSIKQRQNNTESNDIHKALRFTPQKRTPLKNCKPQGK